MGVRRGLGVDHEAVLRIDHALARLQADLRGQLEDGDYGEVYLRLQTGSDAARRPAGVSGVPS